MMVGCRRAWRPIGSSILPSRPIDSLASPDLPDTDSEVCSYAAIFGAGDPSDETLRYEDFRQLALDCSSGEMV